MPLTAIQALQAIILTIGVYILYKVFRAIIRTLRALRSMIRTITHPIIWLIHKLTTHHKRHTIPQDTKAKLFSLHGPTCWNCGQDHDLQIDHIVPFSKGGNDTLTNFAILCGNCNRRKSNG